MPDGKKEHRSPAAEGVGFRINEGPRPKPALPFKATYLGEGVVAVEGVGLFARWTCAEVDAETAARLRQDPARWQVTAAPGGRDAAS